MVGSCSLSFSKMSPQCHLGWRTRDIFLVAKARGVRHSGHLPGEGRAPVAFRSLLFTWFCPHQEATRRRLTPIPSIFGLTWDHQGEGPEEPALSVFPRLGSEVRQKPLGSQGESGVMAKVRFHFCTHSYPSLASAATEQVRKAPLSCLCCSVWHRRSSWDLMAHGEEPPGHPQGPPVLSASPLPVNDLVEPQQHHQLLPRQ